MLQGKHWTWLHDPLSFNPLSIYVLLSIDTFLLLLVTNCIMLLTCLWYPWSLGMLLILLILVLILVQDFVPFQPLYNQSAS